MTNTFNHSYQVQQGDDASEMAMRRNRRQRALPPGRNVMHLPNNEWGFLLSGVKHFQGELIEAIEKHGTLTKDDTRWINDRLIEANLLINLIAGPEFRRGYCDWYESVSEELELIAAKQTPR